MSFLNPLWLWGVLAAVGVATPIVVHMLNRQRGAELDWAAMSLLRRAMDHRAQRVRFEDRLLLLLRCVALLLLAGAMARPTLHGARGGWFGGPREVGAVIGVDVSYSMSYSEVRSRLAEARRATVQIASGLSVGEPISVVALGREPRVLLDRAAYSEARLSKALEGLSAQPGPIDLAAGLGAMAELSRETGADVRSCYIISDGQATSWSSLSDEATAALRSIGEAGKVEFVTVGAGEATNLAIERLVPGSGSLRAGTTAKFIATVRNGGDRPVDGASVTLYADGEPVERSSVSALAPGASAEASLAVRLGETGPVVLEARLTPDNLPADDARLMVVSVREPIDVLVVDGDPSPGRYESESAFVMAALRPTPGTSGGAGETLRLQRVASEEWRSLRSELGRYEVIITTNVGRIDDALLEPLREWVRSGGGLLMFPGDQVSGPVFNRQVAAGRSPLSPARLSGVIAAGRESTGWAIEAADTTHRLGRLLGTLPGDMAVATRMRRYFRLAPVEGAKAVWRVSERGHPALVEHRFGRGRVMLFASTADRDWTDLPVLPVFPMMLHEAVTRLTSPAHEGALTVGQPVTVDLAQRPAGDRVRVVRPDGVIEPVAFEVDRGRASVRYTGADVPGVYRVAEESEGGGMPVAVNIEASESDVRGLGRAALSVALGEGVSMLDEREWAKSVAEAREGFELWPILMGAGLVVLLIELWLARRFTRAVDLGAVAEAGVAPRPHAAGAQRTAA